MAKIWLPKLWASTIPSIWTCGRPNSEKGARGYGPRNPCCAVSPKSEQIIFQSRFGDLIFISKERNEYQSLRQFRVIQPGHQVCIIWSPNVGDMALARHGYKTGKSGRYWFYGNQGRSHARKGGACPKATLGYKYNPLGTQESNRSIQSPESRRHEVEAPGRSRWPPQVLELLRRWPRPCPSRHGWPCVTKPWWSSGAATWIR
jgi:hypothetical protein